MPKPRHLLVADGLTLTAAAALGLAGTRHLWESCADPSFWSLEEGWSAGATIRRLTILVVILLPVLAAGTAAVLVARFTPPRPSRHRIALQPGSAACGVAVLVLTAEALAQAATLLDVQSRECVYSQRYMVTSGLIKMDSLHVLLLGLPSDQRRGDRGVGNSLPRVAVVDPERAGSTVPVGLWGSAGSRLRFSFGLTGTSSMGGCRWFCSDGR